MLTGFEGIATGLTHEAATRVRYVMNILENGSPGIPIGSRQLEARLGCNGPTVRGIVSFLRENGYPVCSDKRGYWLAQSWDDLHRTIKHLSERHDRLETVIEGLRTAAPLNQVKRR